MTSKRRLSLAMLLVAALSAIPVSAAQTYNFALIPNDGIIAGGAGSTIGWGYSLTNQSSTEWLVTTGLAADPLLAARPVPVFDFPTLAPGAKIVQPFNAQALTGLLGLTWDQNAPDDLANFGTFLLDAEWWSGDPSTTGAYLADAPEAQAKYYAFVQGGGQAPEPSSLLLESIGLGLLTVGFLIWTRIHSKKW